MNEERVCVRTMDGGYRPNIFKYYALRPLALALLLSVPRARTRASLAAARMTGRMQSSARGCVCVCAAFCVLCVFHIQRSNISPIKLYFRAAACIVPSLLLSFQVSRSTKANAHWYRRIMRNTNTRVCFCPKFFFYSPLVLFSCFILLIAEKTHSGEGEDRPSGSAVVCHSNNRTRAHHCGCTHSQLSFWHFAPNTRHDRFSSARYTHTHTHTHTLQQKSSTHTHTESGLFHNFFFLLFVWQTANNDKEAGGKQWWRALTTTPPRWDSGRRMRTSSSHDSRCAARRMTTGFSSPHPHPPSQFHDTHARVGVIEEVRGLVSHFFRRRLPGQHPLLSLSLFFFAQWSTTTTQPSSRALCARAEIKQFLHPLSSRAYRTRHSREKCGESHLIQHPPVVYVLVPRTTTRPAGQKFFFFLVFSRHQLKKDRSSHPCIFCFVSGEAR